MRGEAGVVVARVAGDFATQPFRPFERLGFGFQLEFGDDQSGVVAEELVDFPARACVLDPPCDCLISSCVFAPLRYFEMNMALR